MKKQGDKQMVTIPPVVRHQVHLLDELVIQKTYLLFFSLYRVLERPLADPQSEDITTQ